MFNFTLKSSQAKSVNIYFSTRNLYFLGENTSKYCSQITVVHVYATVFSKVHPAYHNIVNGIKPGSDSRKIKDSDTTVSDPYGDPFPTMNQLTVIEEGVRKLLQKSNPRKAPGTDIPALLLKECTEDLAPILA